MLQKTSFSQILQLFQFHDLLISFSASLPKDFSWTLDQITTSPKEVKPQGILMIYSDKEAQIKNLVKEAAEDCLIISELECSDRHFIQVQNGRRAWAFLMAAFCQNPQKKMKLIGITGTNGKTSTVWMIKELLKTQNKPYLCMGTLGIFFSTGEEYAPKHTTPDPDQLYPLLAKAVSQGILYGVMEVSSHAISQHKLDPLMFDGFAFTSFSQDHLDYHGTMEAYAKTKVLPLAHQLKEEKALAIVHGEVQKQLLRDFHIDLSHFPSYGSHSHFDYHIKYVSKHHQVHISFDQNTMIKGEVPFFGEYTLENFLAAWILTSHILHGKPIKPEYWAMIKPIPGRLEPIFVTDKEDQPLVIVDYAHTPDGLEKALKALRSETRGDLWVVFGCGGNRDQGKRPSMARVAEMYADRIIVTSDNPRHEQPEQIIQDILQGFSAQALKEKVTVIEDRRKAIKEAISNIYHQPKHTLLIAGKGHENTQEIGTEKWPFDDRVEARECLLFYSCLH